MDNKVNVRKTRELVFIARQLEEEAERLRQKAKEMCSHKDAEGRLCLFSTDNKCMGCDAVVSFTVNDEVIYNHL